MTAVAPRPVVTRPLPGAHAPRSAASSSVPADDGPEGPRRHVHRHLVRLLHDRRRDGAVHARRAGPAGDAVPAPTSSTTSCSPCTARSCCCSTQPPIVFGFANFVLPLQIGAPDVAFPRLNAFSYWLYLFGALIAMSGFFTPGGAAAFGWTAYTAAVRLGELAGRRRRPVDHGPGRLRPRHHPRRRQHDHHGDLPARPGHDDVAAADLHLEHPGDLDPDPDRVPGADRGAVRPGGRPTLRRPTSSTRPTAGRSCSSTCSGSSGTPRSTSSRCRSSASSPRSSRCSPGNRCSATGAWSTPPLRIAALSVGGVGAPHVRHRRRAAARSSAS